MADDGRNQRAKRELEEMERRSQAAAERQQPQARDLSAREKLENFWWGEKRQDASGPFAAWQREPNGALHGLADGLREAFADIRKKLVEEGWFGREVTPKEVTYPEGGIHGRPEYVGPTAMQSQFLELCRANEQLRQDPPEQDRGKAGPDIDR